MSNSQKKFYIVQDDLNSSIKGESPCVKDLLNLLLAQSSIACRYSNVFLCFGEWWQYLKMQFMYC